MTNSTELSYEIATETASQIRKGIHNYLATLDLIAKANKEQHWQILKYDSWQSYIDGEFGTERLKLSVDQRRQAVEALRMAGMSQRAIGAAVGVSKTTVQDDLATLGNDVVGKDHLTPVSTAPTTGRDGKIYMPRPPVTRDPEIAKVQDLSNEEVTAIIDQSDADKLEYRKTDLIDLEFDDVSTTLLLAKREIKHSYDHSQELDFAFSEDQKGHLLRELDKFQNIVSAFRDRLTGKSIDQELMELFDE